MPIRRALISRQFRCDIEMSRAMSPAATATEKIPKITDLNFNFGSDADGELFAGAEVSRDGRVTGKAPLSPIAAEY